MRANQSQQRTSSVKAVDIKDLEMANKAAKTIEDLEKLLHERTDELETCMNDLSIFEQTVQTLEQIKIEQEEELAEANELLDSQAKKIFEQEELIEKMAL